MVSEDSKRRIEQRFFILATAEKVAVTAVAVY